MFLIKPFEKNSSVRSALGFMSLTSRWGGVMFPGITVLTRDLNDILAIYKLIQEKKSKDKLDLKKFKSKDMDDEIALMLIKTLGKGKKADYTQVMSYWQRYGSLVQYFQLFSAEKNINYKRLQEIIFHGPKPKEGEPSDLKDEKRKRVRHIRIENAAWYMTFRKNFKIDITPENITGILQNKSLYWWITGRNCQPKDNVPEIIQLSRKLEFALTVWQTALETSTILIKRNRDVPKKGYKNPKAIDSFLYNLLLLNHKQGSDKVLSDLAQACLDVHETFFNDGSFGAWEKRLKTWLEIYYPHTNFIRYITFHDTSKNVTGLASLSSKEILETLAKIHCCYCGLQKKTDSIYIHSFEERRLGKKFPEISAVYQQGRWGLFGYRLEASVSLYRSDKYRDKNV